jgi:hypothetical protein
MLKSKQCAKTLTLFIILSLTACGTDPGERALSGGGIGAAAGVGAAVLGAPLLPAVVIGGAVGAATGALTSPNKINLDNR